MFRVFLIKRLLYIYSTLLLILALILHMQCLLWRNVPQIARKSTVPQWNAFSSISQELLIMHYALQTHLLQLLLLPIHMLIMQAILMTGKSTTAIFFLFNNGPIFGLVANNPAPLHLLRSLNMLHHLPLKKLYGPVAFLLTLGFLKRPLPFFSQITNMRYG